MNRGKEAATPAGCPAIGLILTGQQHHEARQIATLAANSIGEPRAQTGAAGNLMSGVHQDLSRCMVELRGSHRPHDGDLIGDFRKVRQQIRKLRTALAVPRESMRRSEQLWNTLDKSE